MARTKRQQREAERRRQQRRLERRRQREARRKRLTLVASLIVTLAVIVFAVVVVVATRNGDDTPATASSSGSSSASAVPCGQQQFTATKVRAATGAAVTFAGVRVKGAADLGGKPGVTSKATAGPAKLRYKDLVVGTGKAAGPTSCVTIQYDGVLYKNGTEFDSSWSRAMPAQFSLSRVVPGFTQGIGGTTGVPPMKEGGRRVIVVPAALGYGAQGSPPKIGPNAPLVFVVDLKKVTKG